MNTTANITPLYNYDNVIQFPLPTKYTRPEPPKKSTETILNTFDNEIEYHNALPIRDKQTIQRILDYYWNLHMKSYNTAQKWSSRKWNPTYLRNHRMFIIGFHCGLRISDLKVLQLGHFIREDGTYKEIFSVREQKTKNRKPDKETRTVYVTEEMKDKVIAQCKNRSRIPARRLIAFAACGVIILGALGLSEGPRLKNLLESQPNQQMNIFSATTATPGVASAQAPKDNGGAEKSGTGQGATVEWKPANLEEAGAGFGLEFLAPAYTPDDYKLGQINASGADTKNAVKVVITYSSGNRSFTITEQKESGVANTPELFKDYRKVKIGGSDGYIKTAAPGESSDSGTANTEIHWFKNDIHYSVTGELTQEDALMTAELMLPLSK
jgi:hypothetical protein